MYCNRNVKGNNKTKQDQAEQQWASSLWTKDTGREFQNLGKKLKSSFNKNSSTLRYDQRRTVG